MSVPTGARSGVVTLLATVAAILLAVVLFFAPPAVSNAAPAKEPFNLLTLPVAVEGDCGLCDGTCNLGSGAFGHIAVENAGGSRSKGIAWHGDCWLGDCSVHPLSCDCFCANSSNPQQCLENCTEGPGGLASNEDVAELFAAAAAGDLTLLAEALVHRNVILNSDRRAIQVQGCSGAIIAHLPLSDSQFQFIVSGAPAQAQ